MIRRTLLSLEKSPFENAMNQDLFVHGRRDGWKRLEELLKLMAGGRMKALRKEEIRELGALYRKVTSDLSYAQTKKYDGALLEYLNELTARAYGFLYSGEIHYWNRSLYFLTDEFPGLVLKNLLLVALASLLFFGGAAFGFFHTWMDSRKAEYFLPKQFIENMRDEGVKRDDSIFSDQAKPYISNFIMVNNIQVGILAFALGITLGIGTAWVLVSNGLMLGSLAALFALKGQSLFFWSLILPHGVTELFCIFLCGGSGLMMGYAILVPGDRYRMDSLRRRARPAVKLVLGSIPLFLAAALIEGFITPSALPEEAKLLVASFTLLALLLYMARGRAALKSL
jgi:uncharacterized membrane protein SpoIIM required for sporulation